MVMTDRNFYIIKQSDGTTWSFSFNKDEGIIYKFFKENTWSEYHVLTKEALKNFSVILLPDDSINVLYQDLTGTIILSKYDGEQWNEQKILTNEKNETFSIYFKTAINENKIQIIFSIFNKENNTATLFHQILDEKNNLSSPKIIDRIKYDYDVPFVLYSPDNKELFIMYQRFLNSHEIGYKSFDNDKWSDFKLIDTSKYPFKDYSAIMFNEILHALYIKKEENIDSLNYVHGNHFNFKNNKLFKGTNIESCLIFIIYGEIWCFGIENNKIYSSFSIDNGNNFSNPPYEQYVSSLDIFKSIYISNDPKEMKSILGNEIYFTNDDTLQYLIFSILYPCIKNDEKSNSCLSYIEYYMTEIYLKVLSYQKTFRDKEQLIAQLKYQLEEQTTETLLYKTNFEEINKAHTEFIDLNNQLNRNVNLLQESLTDKEEKLKLLEKMNKEKEEEILSLKDNLSQNVNLLQESLIDKEEILKLLENINKEKEEEIPCFKDNFSQNINLLQETLIDKEEKLKLLENINKEKEEEILLLKDNLSQNVNLLQEILIDRNQKLKALKKINFEKVKELITLKGEIYQEDSKILFLISEIKKLKTTIRIMYTKNYKRHNIY